jgi:hypothetical protein
LLLWLKNPDLAAIDQYHRLGGVLRRREDEIRESKANRTQRYDCNDKILPTNKPRAPIEEVGNAIRLHQPASLELGRGIPR